MKRILVTLALLAALVAVPLAQGLRIMSGATSDLVTVNTKKSLLTTEGQSDSATYIVHAALQSIAVSDGIINLEAEASRGYRISQVCISPGQATAAVWMHWQLFRTTTASSGGTLIASESTTTHSVSKMDPADANWSGLARFAAVEGTSGALLDAGTVFVNVALTPPAVSPTYCREYGLEGGKLPTVAAGVGNGVKLMVLGSAGGAGMSAMIRFIAQ